MLRESRCELVVAEMSMLTESKVEEDPTAGVWEQALTFDFKEELTLEVVSC